MPAIGDLAYNPGMCPGWELNRRPLGLSEVAQPTEVHCQGQSLVFNMV